LRAHGPSRHAVARTSESRELVDHAAVPSDLAIGAGLHLDVSHLHHRRRELLLPPSRVEGVEEHRQRGLVRLEQRGVGIEQAVAADDVAVVLVVHPVGRHEVLHHHGVVAGVGLAGTLLPQLACEHRVHAAAAGGAQARGHAPLAGRAVGVADAVRAGEHNEVVDGEALGPEVVDELLQRVERRGQVGQRLAGERHAAIAAATRQPVADPAAAEEAGRVACGELDDVGPGDDAGAGGLEPGLGRVDHLVPAQALVVGDAQLLRLRVRRRRVEQHGCVAA
jgi:hypothetical protein